MITTITIFVFILFLITPIMFYDYSFSQMPETAPRQQWNHLPDPDSLTCKSGLILLQKNDGSPACVIPSTYLKLVDRGYGKFDSSQLMKRSEMMLSLMREITKDTRLSNHWHTMMKNDPKILHQAMSEMVINLKENPALFEHVIGPMMINSEMQKEMIVQMKKNDQMMMSLQDNPKWMDSVHKSAMDTNKQIDPERDERNECSWCMDTDTNHNSKNHDFHQPKIMENIVHHMWINEKMRNQVQFFMLENPDHMEIMANQLMEPILEYIISDPDLRQQMILMMMENQEFMNSIRHENQIID